METLFSVIFITLILSFLVLIHEAGHYFFAKLFKINVHEFGLGYPPRIAKLFKWKETEFTLNAIPFGGFVRIEGEDGQASDGNTDTSKTSQTQPFFEKPAWQKLAIILAGAGVNFVFGIIAFSIFFGVSGFPVLSTQLVQEENASITFFDQVTRLRVDDEYRSVATPYEAVELTRTLGARILSISKDSPAEDANLPLNSQIISITPSDQAPVDINSPEQAIEIISQNRGNTVTLTTTEECSGFECPEATKDFTVSIRSEADTPVGDGSLGVQLGSVVYAYYPTWQMPLRASLVGIQQALGLALLIFQALGSMVRDIFTAGTVPQDVSGIVGIVYQTQQSGIISSGWLSALNFAGLLSVNLAIMNILPIPALDGGRAIFILLERIFGRSKTEKYEVLANYLGYGFLLSLILLITIKDIVQIIQS